MQLGRHFSVEEMSHSGAAVRFGIPNIPGERELRALSDLCRYILDPLRDKAGRPITILSGYRSPAVNRKVGGSPTSQHMLGQAADIRVAGMTPAQVVALIRQMRLPFDQVIEEFGSWTHVSFGPGHRRQALMARKVGGRTVYSPI